MARHPRNLGKDPLGHLTVEMAILSAITIIYRKYLLTQISKFNCESEVDHLIGHPGGCFWEDPKGHVKPAGYGYFL